MLLGLVLSVLAAPAARADALDGALEVQSAFVNQEAGVFQLHARVLYPVNDQLREALRDGVSLSFDLDVSIQRQRRYWVDAEVVALTLPSASTIQVNFFSGFVFDALPGFAAFFRLPPRRRH